MKNKYYFSYKAITCDGKTMLGDGFAWIEKLSEKSIKEVLEKIKKDYSFISVFFDLHHKT